MINSRAILLVLIIADNIDIKGAVIRNSNGNSGIYPYTVIKFCPFGSNENYNSLQALDQLKSLLEK